MPRYYAKTDKSLDFDNILEAIKQVKIQKASIRKASTAHKISRATLGRYIAKFSNIDVATAKEEFMINLLIESSKPGAKTVSFFCRKPNILLNSLLAYSILFPNNLPEKERDFLMFKEPCSSYFYLLSLLCLFRKNVRIDHSSVSLVSFLLRYFLSTTKNSLIFRFLNQSKKLR